MEPELWLCSGLWALGQRAQGRKVPRQEGDRAKSSQRLTGQPYLRGGTFGPLQGGFPPWVPFPPKGAEGRKVLRPVPQCSGSWW